MILTSNGIQEVMIIVTHEPNLICAWKGCQKPFWKPPSIVSRNKFGQFCCSRECYYKLWASITESQKVRCDYCGKKHHVTQSRLNEREFHYCCRKHFHAARLLGLRLVKKMMLNGWLPVENGGQIRERD